jgi:hypothetical protein
VPHKPFLLHGATIGSFLGAKGSIDPINAVLRRSDDSCKKPLNDYPAPMPGRSLLNWTTDDLAQRANMGVATVRKFENGVAWR